MMFASGLSTSNYAYYHKDHKLRKCGAFLHYKINFSEVVVNGNSMYPTLKGNSETGSEFGYTDRFRGNQILKAYVYQGGGD